MAAITGPSFDLAVERGWHMQLATPFSYRLYREKWLDEVEQTVQDVSVRIAESGRDPADYERALVIPFYVAPTMEQAQDEFRDHVEWLYNRVTGLSAEGQATKKVVAGYEQSMRESAKTQELGLLSFEALTAADAVVCGDPEHCIEKLRMIRDRLGITEFMLFINLGGIPAQRIRSCVELAAAEVMPHV
jgi:alkanesulfonate monooxygenase SsuD/methylene tetrahydromethanopterin reductase-like flavin-dependent oxidoreductase (luciferase family)